MIQSPIKFDDLAFILLFFFMIIAVISFSSSMNVDTAEQQSEGETESIAVYLDSNGTLSQSTFSEGDFVDLSVSPETDWVLVQNAVKAISSQNAQVTLVIE